MSSNSNYSEQEWRLISSIPQLTGLLMSTAAYSGIEGTKDELEASLTSIATGRFKYPDNKLITSIVPKGESLEEIIKETKLQQQKLIAKIYIENKEALEEFQKSTLNSYQTVMHYISKIETGIVVNEFKSWLLNIAEDVAVAAIEGTVFGQETDPFSQEEREIFAKIEKKLINS